MLQDLPEFAHQLLIDQHLSELEVKTLRLVCKECKSMVDTSLTTLRPKDIAKLKVNTQTPHQNPVCFHSYFQQATLGKIHIRTSP